MNKSTKYIIFIIVIVLVIWGLSSVSEPVPEDFVPEEVVGEPIKIGVMVPLSGDVASLGENSKQGIELALEDSGLENIELVYQDSGCTGKTAVASINELIIEGVPAIVGELCSGATLAAAPVAEENKIVLISPGSTSPEVSLAGDYIFRTIPSDALQGKFGAQLLSDNGFKKLAILYSNEDYGLGFNNELAASFTELGGEVVAQETYERTAVDHRTQLTKIKNSDADVLYIVGNSIDALIATLKQTEELDIEVTIWR